MKSNDETMFCIKCNEEILPFFPNLSKLNKDLSGAAIPSSLNSIKSFFKGLNEFNDKSNQ